MQHDTLTVVLTGTGTPVPTPGCAGAGTCIRTNGVTLQFDAGRATTMRLAEIGVRPHELDCVFLTHHHSDHLTGLPDLLMTAWLTESEAQIPICTPAGTTTDYAVHSLDPLQGDIEVRFRHRKSKTLPSPHVLPFPVKDAPTTVWEAAGVRVDAVAVRHEPVENAVAYRVDSGAGRVVVSGDTRVCDSVEHLAQDAQILVHEVMDPERIPRSRAHTAEYHSAPVELGALADRAGVERLMLTHIWPAVTSRQDIRSLVDAVRRGGFTGDLIVGSDLTSLTIDGTSIRVSIPEGHGVTGVHVPRVKDRLTL